MGDYDTIKRLDMIEKKIDYLNSVLIKVVDSVSVLDEFVENKDVGRGPLANDVEKAQVVNRRRKANLKKKEEI